LKEDKETTWTTGKKRIRLTEGSVWEKRTRNKAEFDNYSNSLIRPDGAGRTFNIRLRNQNHWRRRKLGGAPGITIPDAEASKVIPVPLSSKI